MMTAEQFRASSWNEASFEIRVKVLANAPDRIEATRGETLFPFAINRRSGAWWLTHLPTGFQFTWVASPERGKRLAERFVELTGGTGPWEKSWWTEFSIPPEIRSVIDAVGTALVEARRE